MKRSFLAALVVGLVLSTAWCTALIVGSWGPAMPAPPDGPTSTDGPPVAVTLTAADTTIAPGESPSFRVSIANLTDRPLLLVRSLDGSASGMRYPRLTVDRTGPAAPQPLLRCGNTNNLREDDFVAVDPGDSFDPLGPGAFGHHLLAQPLTEPGEYRYAMTYDTDEADIDRWWGFMSPKSPGRRLKALLERVPKGVYASNAVTIRVIDPDREDRPNDSP